MRLGVLVVALVLLVCLAAHTLAGSERTLGLQAQGFTAAGIVNHPETTAPLEALRGRTILLVFISTWGDRSSAAVIDMNKLHDALGPDGLTILGVAEEEMEAVTKWVETHKPKWPVCSARFTSQADLVKFYEWPGKPWGYIVNPDGEIVWQGHPQSLEVRKVKPYVKGARAAPRLPEALADQQKLLDEGRWGKAHQQLKELGAGKQVSKPDASWAKRTAAWIERRAVLTFDDAKALEVKGLWWDAWQMYVDYRTRFDGAGDVARAKTLEEAVRADPDAAKDLGQGDKIQKARDLIATAVGSKKKTRLRQAKLILDRAVKKMKGTRHQERAKSILAEMPEG